MEPITSTGAVSEYGLACGYVQRSSKGSSRVDLYREHNTYHVKLVINNKVVFHEGFSSDNLKDARTYFRKLVEAVKQ